MSDTLKEIADNLGVGIVNGGYLSGIAQFYGVNLSTSTDLMKDILTAVGGDPATSTDYLKDIDESKIKNEEQYLKHLIEKKRLDLQKRHQQYLNTTL